ncbi:ABC-2 transporter permease [uncultured Clostridium sp.]|uniref:ABC-2 transporter permease n=1 Tax=uncultured Clostridium sp. TaxID=59620 RepID=UPI0025CDA82B|nr:ABC-2 transporter permease [uncultured Clostridium sp.]
MNNMINLIKLSYSSIVALKKTAILMVIFAIIIMATSVNGSMISVSASLMIMILNYNTLAYEDASKRNFLIYSLPIKPREYILSKYLFGFINVAIAIIVGDLSYIILKSMNIMSFSSISIGEFDIAIIIVGIIVNAIIVPIGIILGCNRARIILFFLVIGTMCFSNAVIPALCKVINIDAGFNISLGAAASIIVILGAVFTIVSYMITAKLYETRDINK